MESVMMRSASLLYSVPVLPPHSGVFPKDDRSGFSIMASTIARDPSRYPRLRITLPPIWKPLSMTMPRPSIVVAPDSGLFLAFLFLIKYFLQKIQRWAAVRLKKRPRKGRECLPTPLPRLSGLYCGITGPGQPEHRLAPG